MQLVGGSRPRQGLDLPQARRRPAAREAPPSAVIRSSARASAEASPTGTRSAASPSVSRKTGRSLTTEGTPKVAASTGGKPNPSSREGCTTRQRSAVELGESLVADAAQELDAGHALQLTGEPAGARDEHRDGRGPARAPRARPARGRRDPCAARAPRRSAGTGSRSPPPSAGRPVTSPGPSSTTSIPAGPVRQPADSRSVRVASLIATTRAAPAGQAARTRQRRATGARRR